jgi:predicted dehydrogenase
MLRVAVVGAGGMARNYRRVYASLPGVQWALAMDVNETVLEDCRREGAGRVSSLFEDALADDIDMVDISTPNHLHEQQAVAALKAGKHVLLQKPMAHTLEAADNIVRAAKESKGVLGMYMSSFTNPLVWEIRKLVQSGALGQIQSIRARDAHRGGLRNRRDPATNWRGSRELTGGGCFTLLSVHAINLMQWWLGARITEAMAFSDNQYCPNVGGDDVTTGVVRFDSNVYGIFDSGYASEGGSREVYGTKGHFRLAGGENELELKLDEPYSSELIHYSTPGKTIKIPVSGRALGDAENPLNQQRMFIDRVKEGKPPHVTAEQGRQDVAVVMAVYESAEKGARVKVE